MQHKDLPDVIGLGGSRGAGKSTVAETLSSVHGYERVRFAGGLKEMLKFLLYYQYLDEETVERLIDGDLKEFASPHLCDQTPRYVMQTLGTEWGRKLVGEDFWVQVTKNRVDSLLKKNKRVVIDDVRFQNEIDMVRSYKRSYSIYIESDSTVQDSHASENSLTLEDFDYSFLNTPDDGVSRLTEKIDDCLEEYNRRNDTFLGIPTFNSFFRKIGL